MILVADGIDKSIRESTHDARPRILLGVGAPDDALLVEAQRLCRSSATGEGLLIRGLFGRQSAGRRHGICRPVRILQPRVNICRPGVRISGYSRSVFVRIADPAGLFRATDSVHLHINWRQFEYVQ